ncbi:MAG TPA: DUF1080 domain-containing protein [Bryobacteraceae bacterium]|nr:DUF1080 domain-containing protein [Bryobacteraceae bacterium]
MVRITAIFLGFISIALSENSLSHQERNDGFELLYDGKTLTRWHSIKLQPDAGSWQGRKGVITWVKGGSWLATDDTYYDFILRLEYRTGPQSNSGIFLRSTPTGNPAFSGMELQILSDAGKPADVHSTGSLYGAVAPSKSMAKPDGEWNQVEITVLKREVTAVWNGEKILDVNLDDHKYQNAQQRPLAERAPFGYIGLQAYSTGAPVEFRNIRIKVLRVGPHFSQDR